MNPKTAGPDPALDMRRALTLHQPWAFLVAMGFKSVENRSFRVKAPLTLYIHAGEKVDAEGLAWVKDHCPEIQLPEKWQHGGIIGVVTVARVTDSGWASGNPAVAKWARPGSIHWILTDAQPLPFEKVRGAQGVWIVGNQKRVLELPEGFTIKTAAQSAPPSPGEDGTLDKTTCDCHE